MQIIDAQIHIWLPESSDRPWPKDRVKPHLPNGLSAEQMLAMMEEAGVSRAIIVPPSWEGERLDYALDSVRRYPDRFRVMARAPLMDPALKGKLREWRDQPGLLGARITFNTTEAGEWLTSGASDWFWAEAEEIDMPLMVLPTWYVDRIDAIAARHPRLRMIIDHIGVYRLSVGDPGFNEALDKTIGLARHPNVHVKVSGLPHFSKEAWPFADVAPHVRRLIDAFGPRRAFWGTDISKMIGTVTYRQCVEQVLNFDFLSESDKEWVLGRGLANFLGWPLD